MASPYEREQLAGIERWFEADDPVLARAMRDGYLPHATALLRAVVCALADLVGVGAFVAGVVLPSFLLLAASAVLVTAALGLHILWPPADRR